MAAALSSSAVSCPGVVAARFNRRAPAARRVRASRVVTAAASSAVETYDAVVIGAGVSGLTTAFTLSRSSPNAKMLVTEARDYVGGNVQSKSKDGYIWEEGPNSYQPGDAILTVACDAGMKDDILLANPNSDRYVLWDKELRALPKDIPTAVLGTFLTWPVGAVTLLCHFSAVLEKCLHPAPPKPSPVLSVSHVRPARHHTRTND